MPENSPLALLLDDNLMTAARVRSQLEKVGYRVQVTRRLPENAPEDPADITSSPQLVILNLGSRTLWGIVLIKTCLQLFPAARVIGFCGHAEVEIRRAAKQAGLSRILTNDEALQDLAKALKLVSFDARANEDTEL
jgi:DNA-binding NarL/FixJ family response regulator